MTERLAVPRRISPGLAPGGSYAVVYVGTSPRVLAAHAVLGDDTPTRSAVDQGTAWLHDHPRDVVRACLYDGDTGECDTVVFIGGAGSLIGRRVVVVTVEDR